TGIQLGDASQPTSSVDLGNLVLVRYAQLTGRVLDNVGAGLGNVTVHAQQIATRADTAVSAGDGSFVLWVPRGDDYRVFGDDTPNHVTPVPVPAPGTAGLTVGAGEIVTGLDLVY